MLCGQIKLLNHELDVTHFHTGLPMHSAYTVNVMFYSNHIV